MKQIFLTVFMVLFAVNISANTSCKVEGSSNNNVATLGESYYHSGAKASGGNKCFVRTSVTLAKRSLGRTVVVIEVFDQYNQSVGNKMVIIDEGNQYSGEVRFEVNNSSYDGVCGEYNFKITSATCEEKKKDTSMKKPSAYTDLGLPSGTLWRNSNEKDKTEYFMHNEASYKYDDALPTKAQWEELIDNCKWEWTKNPYGANVTGPNGNSIFLPADGGNYISRYRETDDNGWGHTVVCKKHKDKRLSLGYYCAAFDPITKAWYQVEFDSKDVKMAPAKFLGDEMSVRLVKTPTENNIPTFVDLGLPSGTKWKNVDEEEGSSKYSYEILEPSIPTKKQWTELEKSCTWTWLGTRYRVTGPNGNSIYFKPYGFSYKCYECDLFDLTSTETYYIKDMNCMDGACEYFDISEGGYGIIEDDLGSITNYNGDICNDNSTQKVNEHREKGVRIRLVEAPKAK